jgi:ATP-binding cassette subfamily B protein AbcA/BmrA
MLEGTLRENITYGCQRDVSEEELWQVAKKANLEDLIRSLPNGFNTSVAPDGRNFSCGQRQCIAIARALLHDPAYLLLDMATGNLDAKGERATTDALCSLMKGRTTVMIPGSLSDIRRADLVLVLKDGKIVISGSPADIIKDSEAYQGILTGQETCS